MSNLGPKAEGVSANEGSPGPSTPPIPPKTQAKSTLSSDTASATEFGIGKAGRGHRIGHERSATGKIVLSVIVSIAAIAATYWTSVGNDGNRVAPPNATLRDVALQLLHPAKGILAADESPSTFGKRLNASVANKAAIRRSWRQTLLATTGLEQHISGVILHEETFAQLPADIAAAVARGMAVGIKLDEGTVPLQPMKAGERITQGLKGLAERCQRFRNLTFALDKAQGKGQVQVAASFAKWRSVFRVGPHTPSKGIIRRNANDLAEFAAVTQRCGMVPIVEPEVLVEGSHDLQRAAAAASRVLRAMFRALRRRSDVDLGAVLLKAAMVTPGDQARERATPEQVANSTLRVLLRTVPRVVPGIVFLSGGQSEDTATANLLALGRIVRQRKQAGKPPLPWALSFSFGRALQTSALAAWEQADVAGAQAALLRLARANGLAQQGLGEKDQQQQLQHAQAKRKDKKAKKDGGASKAPAAGTG